MLLKKLLPSGFQYRFYHCWLKIVFPTARIIIVAEQGTILHISRVLVWEVSPICLHQSVIIFMITKHISWEEMIKALEADFKGYEQIQYEIDL